MTDDEWQKKSKDFKENILKNKIEDRWRKEIQRLQGEEIDERSTKMTIEETIGVVFSRAAETARNRRFSTTRSYDLIETGTGNLWRAKITLTFSVVRFLNGR